MKVFEFHDAYSPGAHIRGDDALLVIRNVDHVGAILSGAENPVDLLRGRVVAPYRLGSFCRKPGFPADKGESVRAAKGTEVDGGQSAMSNQVDHRQRVVCPEAVVGDIRSGAVRRCDDLVGIVAHWHARDDLERGWVDDAESVVVLGKDKQRRARRSLATENDAEADDGDERNELDGRTGTLIDELYLGLEITAERRDRENGRIDDMSDAEFASRESLLRISAVSRRCGPCCGWA